MISEIRKEERNEEIRLQYDTYQRAYDLEEYQT